MEPYFDLQFLFCTWLPAFHFCLGTLENPDGKVGIFGKSRQKWASLCVLFLYHLAVKKGAFRKLKNDVCALQLRWSDVVLTFMQASVVFR